MRRVFLLFFCAAALLFYAGVVEPDRVTVEEIVIPDDMLWQEWGETKIALVSDLHIDQPGSREEKLVRMMREINPDLIVIAGDLIQWDSSPVAAIDYVAGLHAPLGVYAVLGDSDMASGRHQCLFCHPGGNVQQLRLHPHFFKNNFLSLDLKSRERKMILCGFLPVNEGETDQSFSLKLPDSEKSPLLVLSHFSAGWKTAVMDRPLLWLAGDTHGGQIRLPEFLWKRLGLADYPEYRSGLYTDGRHRWLYVSRGMGTSPWFPFRFGVPPEITVIRFQERN